ncbi:hypothetical protein Pelo_2158 [Pelomyxa schiedti]|nr:hypothetical protein Pelo_2158 [Pelomyxa schiedti]
MGITESNQHFIGSRVVEFLPNRSVCDVSLLCRQFLVLSAHECRRRIAEITWPSNFAYSGANFLPEMRCTCVSQLAPGSGCLRCCAWWLGLFRDYFCCGFSDAAMQIAFLSIGERLVFLEPTRSVRIAATLNEPFPVGDHVTIARLPPLLLPDSALWWDAVDKMTQSNVNKVIGSTVSDGGFLKGDVAAVLSLNALDSKEEMGCSIYERAMFMVLLLRDRRFALVCEGSYVDSVHSQAFVRTSVWVAPTLRDLVSLALGDKERRILAVRALPSQSAPNPENTRFTTMYKKVKPHRRFVKHEGGSTTEIVEPEGSVLDSWLQHAISSAHIAEDNVLYSQTPSSCSGDEEIYERFKKVWPFSTGSYTSCEYLPSVPEYEEWWPNYVWDERTAAPGEWPDSDSDSE